MRSTDRSRSGSQTCTRRLQAALVVGLVVWAGLVGRLLMIQLVCSSRLSNCAQEQHVDNVRLAPARGPIYDRNMTALTMNLTVESACAYPTAIRDRDAFAREVQSVLGGRRSSYVDRLKSGKHFAWIGRQLEPETAARLRAKDIDGLGFHKESKRVYPYGKTAGHVIGMTDIDGKGIGGIEHSMDDLLVGSEAWVYYQLDREGHRKPSASCVRIEPRDGLSIVLTLDLELQAIAEVELERAVAEHEAKAGTVIIQNPHTGEILAMANHPTFDPNHPELYPADSRRNRAVTDQYEPGSTLKVITASAALATGAADLTSVYYAERGRMRFGRFFIRDVHEHGWMSFEDAVWHSSNICLAQIAEDVGKQTLFEYATDFGVGCLTGVELPGEVRGTLREPWLWSKRSVHSIGIGQEVAVTALQLVGVYSAIANGGVLMEPRIVKAVLADDGRVVRLATPKAVRPVIEPEVAAVMRTLLSGVVERGTGSLAAVSEVPVSGKTGTAQKAENGTYSSTKHVSSFVGFVPSHAPGLVCLVMIDEPKGRGLGGQVAAPAFARIVERIARGPQWRLLEPCTTRMEPTRRALMSLYAEAHARSTALTTSELELEPVGSGAGLAQSEQGRGRRDRHTRRELTEMARPMGPHGGQQGEGPAGEAGRDPGNDSAANVAARAESAAVSVPNLTGMSVRAARRATARLGLELCFEGSGRVRRQSPRPGARASAGGKVIVSCYAG